MTDQNITQFDQLVEQYLGLESMEVIEELLDLCGARIDARALPFLRRRLQEEEATIPALEDRGYTRMREKCEQLVISLKTLITGLEEANHDPADESKASQH
jgi:hypothetical protein